MRITWKMHTPYSYLSSVYQYAIILYMDINPRKELLQHLQLKCGYSHDTHCNHSITTCILRFPRSGPCFICVEQLGCFTLYLVLIIQLFSDAQFQLFHSAAEMIQGWLSDTGLEAGQKAHFQTY